MAYGYVQLAQGSTGASTPNNVAGTFGSANTASNLIFAATFYDGNGVSGVPTGTAVTDSQGNTYNQIGSVSDSTNGYQVSIFYAKNIIGGSSNVATATYTGAPASSYYKGILVAEYSGLDTAAPFTSGQWAGQEQTSSTGAANELISGNTPSLAVQPCAVIGFSTILHNTQGAPSAGNSPLAFNQRGQVWNFTTAFEFACLEDVRVTTTAAVQATFSPAGSGQKFANFVVVFNEVGASGPAFVPYMPYGLQPQLAC